MSVMHHCIPQVTVKVKNNPPWLTNDLLTNIRKKNSLYRRARKSGKEEDLRTTKIIEIYLQICSKLNFLTG